MFKRLVNFVVLFALVLFVSGVVAFISSPKAYAAGCSGTGCDGLDPHDTGCDLNPYTLDWDIIVVAKSSQLRLRGDNTCHTNWTWAITYLDWSTQTLHISRAAGDPGSGVDARTISNNLVCADACWGDQLYATYEVAQACIYGQYLDQPGFCTDWM